MFDDVKSGLSRRGIGREQRTGTATLLRELPSSHGRELKVTVSKDLKRVQAPGRVVRANCILEQSIVSLVSWSRMRIRCDSTT